MANPEEIVDIVDEADNILYQIPKREAHERGLLHRTAIGEIIDSQGRWVLVQQAPGKQEVGQFVSPVGGHVSAGETEDEGLKREAKEECGLSDFKFKPVGKKIFNRNILGRQENHYFILYEIYSDMAVTLNEESVSYRFFTEQEIKDALKNTPKLFGNSFHFQVKTFYPNLLD
jgi:8-oxo-dGTP pyrophosphatase MutT (NUDIX family)